MEKPYNLLAGHVALDFANTLDDRFAPGGPIELLASYNDLLRFCVQAGSSDQATLETLRLATPERQTDALVRAIELREAIYHIFSAVVERRVPQHPDLDTLNHQLTAALPHRHIKPVKPVKPGTVHSIPISRNVNPTPAFAWTWHNAATEAASPLWPIALAAAELLTSPDRELVRECQSDTCRWLFLYHSKNHSRRWCDMRSCGNRVKARRFHERQTTNRK